MENQKQFISWLYKKLNVKSEQELKSAIQKMGDKGVQEKYKEFQKEQESLTDEDSGTSIPMSKNGGKLDYIKCLEQFKKGGKMKSCGCGGKMKKGTKIPKAQFGAILGALKGASSFGKVAKTVGDVAGTVSKVGNALQSVKSVTNRMMPSYNVSTVQPNEVPGNITPTTATTTPKLNQRSIPQVKMEEGGEIKKDTKLERLKNLKKIKK